MSDKPLPFKNALRARFNGEFLRRLLRPRSFGRFTIIGGLNTVVGIGTFPLLYWMSGRFLGVNVLVVLSWIVSTSFAFLLHKLVTFESEGAYHNEGMKFLLLSLMSLGISLLVMNVVMSFTHIHPVLVQVATSTGLGIALMIFNYLGMARFIFTAPAADNIKD